MVGTQKRRKHATITDASGIDLSTPPPGHESLPRLLARATGSQPDTQESGSLS